MQSSQLSNQVRHQPRNQPHNQLRNQAPKYLLDYSLADLNAQFKDATPLQIAQWAIANAEKPMASTSFGRMSAVMIKLIHQAQQDTGRSIPLIWLDSGYATDDTIAHVAALSERFELDVQRKSPALTPNDIVDKWGGIPNALTQPEEFAEFVEIVKLEPFDRMVEELQSDAWITGIRKTETQLRNTLDIFTQSRPKLVRVAPIFYYSNDDMAAFSKQHSLPLYFNYFDPTKTSESDECGLHSART